MELLRGYRVRLQPARNKDGIIEKGQLILRSKINQHFRALSRAIPR